MGYAAANVTIVKARTCFDCFDRGTLTLNMSVEMYAILIAGW
jgi:hypothetical protein